MGGIRRDLIWMWLLLFTLSIQQSVQVKKPKTAVVTNIEDMKDFKKLLRTKTNVLILFINAPKAAAAVSDVVNNVADNMKGQATLVSIDCNTDTKKICKKLKIPSDKPYYIKHYKDGEFHKDYDRGETLSAMTNFLRDPTGDLPWEEDPKAADIFHLSDGEALNRFLKRGAVTNKRAMVMFYAPWCGYCKTLKPEYVQAAADLKGEALLAAIDVAKPGNSKVRQLYNITGFPTLLFYDKGQLRFPYSGDNKRQAIVQFIRDPAPRAAPSPSPEPQDDSWGQDTDVVQLTGDNFDSVLSGADNALVVFYAPWCGHCKRLKPELVRAATIVREQKINGILAAVDATQNADLASRFGVRGYPTLKYFRRGEFMYDAGHARKADQIVDFIKDPKEPPPPPPPEKPWSEEAGAVRHLTAETFRGALRKIRHALVMFYAPWCGHCKSLKPSFVAAAEQFADELSVSFAAVDCTESGELCKSYGVQGYPTLKYFSHFDKTIEDYTGDRKTEGLVSYIHSHMGSRRASKPELTNQQAGFGPNVLLASDNNFENIVASATPTFMMFYATWCGHCVEAKPAFSRLATAVKAEKVPVTVAAVDAADNPKAADIAGVQTLPTFKMFVNGKIVADYEGDRSTEDMMAFCKAHRVKDEL